MKLFIFPLIALIILAGCQKIKSDAENFIDQAKETKAEIDQTVDNIKTANQKVTEAKDAIKSIR